MRRVGGYRLAPGIPFPRADRPCLQREAHMLLAGPMLRLGIRERVGPPALLFECARAGDGAREIARQTFQELAVILVERLARVQARDREANDLPGANDG